MDQIHKLMQIAGAKVLSDRDQTFADSLCDSYLKNKSLSPKQMYWVNILIERAAPIADKQTVATAISVPGIVELLRRNNNAKRPKIRFLVGEISFTLSIAGSKSRVPGSINVTSDAGWYGRIHTDGRYEPSTRFNDEMHTIVIQALNVVAQDPAKAAAEYGKKFGRCCFCWLGLEDPKSLTVGYGPICAKHYKLPWNVSALEKLVLVKDLTNEQAFG